MLWKAVSYSRLMLYCIRSAADHGRRAIPPPACRVSSPPQAGGVRRMRVDILLRFLVNRVPNNSRCVQATVWTLVIIRPPPGGCVFYDDIWRWTRAAGRFVDHATTCAGRRHANDRLCDVQTTPASECEARWPGCYKSRPGGHDESASAAPDGEDWIHPANKVGRSSSTNPTQQGNSQDCSPVPSDLKISSSLSVKKSITGIVEG